MNSQQISRRQLLKQGGVTATGLALLQTSWLAQAFPSRPGEETVPWLDQAPANPSGGAVANLQPTEELASWLTPTEKFFQVAHYNKPVIEEGSWRLTVDGLVKQPGAFDLSALRARARQEVVYTLECSGNHGFPWFVTGIGNAKWAGTPLAPLLKEAGPLEEGVEVVFWGTDSGEETVRDLKVSQQFARSMSMHDAMNPANLLCYEMNGAALLPQHGFPLRLVAPGWYGIANVKWLQRIEVRDSRFMGRFMARDYVTLREDQRDGESRWMETSVGRSLIKSMPVKVTRKDGEYQVVGMAWGAPIAKVELQVDSGPWLEATIDRSEEAEFAWKPWSVPLAKVPAGTHTVTSRATDNRGNLQPAMDDPRIAKKKTYWESNGQVSRRVQLG